MLFIWSKVRVRFQNKKKFDLPEGKWMEIILSQYILLIIYFYIILKTNKYLKADDRFQIKFLSEISNEAQ